jgi:tRNA pseudouridine55 synthase
VATTPAPSGFLNIHKPVGGTSHDVVNQVRRALGTKHVGHAGTLDPLAEGVLIVCVGGAARLSDYVMTSTKTYRAVVWLGRETTTYDAEGDITAESDASGITPDDIRAALPRFTGDIQQLPPIYSAIKKDGRKLYDIARSGGTVELTPRPVTIHAIDIESYDAPMLTLTVTCSAGTYIRSLAHDLGAALGVGGSLNGLTRTASGAFRLEEAVPLAAFMADDQPARWLIPAQDALPDWPRVLLTDAQFAELRQGRTIPRDEPQADGSLALALLDGTLAALLRADPGRWQPVKVLLTRQ